MRTGTAFLGDFRVPGMGVFWGFLGVLGVYRVYDILGLLRTFAKDRNYKQQQKFFCK